MINTVHIQYVTPFYKKIPVIVKQRTV